MNLHDQIGQMFSVGFYGTTAPDYLLDWLREGRVGGIILFARNVESAEQLAALTASLHAAAKTPILIGIDQEGGAIARLRAPYFGEIPGALALASTADAETNTKAAYGIIGAELRALGINWDYAPVVDLTYNRDNPTVGTRSFGQDPETVSALASEAVRGLQAHGVAACAKHFPGLGATSVDTHLALPTLDTSVEELMTSDLIPYRAVIGAGIASIMTTHTIYSALDAQHPATLSGVVVMQMLRDRLGYDGVVVSDCMEMKAIADNYGSAESAILAAQAGLDMILISHTRERQAEAFDALLAAVESGRVPLKRVEEAVGRVQALKAKFPAQPADLSTVRTAESLAEARRIAQGAVVLVRGALPVDLSQRVLCIEFASVLDSEVVEKGGIAGFAKLWQARTGLPAVSIKVDDDTRFAEALADVRRSDTVIVATRSAHLSEQQARKARALLTAAPSSVLVALRNPFDPAVLTEAQTALCTVGDAEPQLEAAADALLGHFLPAGSPPINLE
ncbi:MAG: beta-N-acetylhexosaminidase [Anaerolineae bacterium]|nr:beta-N-acetylhexosaminidase [Anaerolineae bacterium]